jgi:uncharacterized protein YukE
MPQAVVDPVALRRFAQQLKSFNEELHNKLTVLHGQMAALGDTWRDQEHEKFLTAYEQTRLMLQKFMEASQQHIPFLQKKAERIEEYLSLR